MIVLLIRSRENSSHADVIRFTFACANGRLTCFGSCGLLFLFCGLGLGFDLGGVLIHLFLVVALVVMAIDLLSRGRSTV